MELRLYSSDRDAELLRDLLVLIPFDIVQYERGPRARRQSRDRPFEVDLELRRIARCERTDLTRIIHRQHSRDATLVAPRVFQHRVHREPVKPRGTRAFPPEPLE